MLVEDEMASQDMVLCPMSDCMIQFFEGSF